MTQFIRRLLFLPVFLVVVVSAQTHRDGGGPAVVLFFPPPLQLVKGFPAEAVGHAGALVLIQLSMSLWASYPSDPLVVEVRLIRTERAAASGSASQCDLCSKGFCRALCTS